MVVIRELFGEMSRKLVHFQLELHLEYLNHFFQK